VSLFFVFIELLPVQWAWVLAFQLLGVSAQAEQPIFVQERFFHLGKDQ
jgi:hypothetical protein